MVLLADFGFILKTISPARWDSLGREPRSKQRQADGLFSDHTLRRKCSPSKQQLGWWLLSGRADAE